MGAAEDYSEEKFSFHTEKRKGATVVFINGFIDEDAEFSDIERIKGSIIINFSSLTGINSCGVRNWVNFMKNIANREVYYEECPPALVRQMNMIPSVVGNAEVLSVYVPYICDACEHEAELLVSQEKFAGGEIAVDEVIKCDSCSADEMVMDGNPEQYFSFARK